VVYAVQRLAPLSVSELEPLNAASFHVVVMLLPAPKITVVRPVQFLKPLLPILVTLPGMSMLVRLAQP
jgi:hypothetical protein